MEIGDYWAPQRIDNPELKSDLSKYFFTEKDSKQIDELLSKHKHQLTVICDRFEFIQKLMNFKKILIKYRKYEKPKSEEIILDGKKAFAITRIEHIDFEGFEFNGLTYDIDALAQYLQLTLIDTIMGSADYLHIVPWLKKQSSNKTFSIEELDAFHDKYIENNGLRKNFIKAFTIISDDLQKKISDTFLIAKLANNGIEQESYNYWIGLSERDKYLKIVRYLYDDIRCKYTHSSIRNFLSDTHIMGRQSTSFKVLISKVDPKKITLFDLLNEVIKELLISRYDKIV